MPKWKFKEGDRVQMTKEARAANSGHRSFVGVVVARNRVPQLIRVRRDGQKTVLTWHENAWEKEKRNVG